MVTVPVLLAGGIGERFWPLSRSTMPKQLLRLISSKTMIEETLARIAPLCSKGVRPVIITGAAIAPIIRRTLPRKLRYDMIVEPVGKDSGPAVAIGAAYVQHKYGDAVMVVLSADHAIAPRSEYLAAVSYAAGIARERGSLVVFGVKPTRPDTGYGYVELGEEIGSQGTAYAHQVKRFVEKPDLKTAEQYVASGRYLWNGGMFVWKTSVILEEFAAYMPALHRLLAKVGPRNFAQPAVDEYYRKAQKKSVDYAVMERSTRVAVVCGAFTWDDIGSWESMLRVHTPDQNGTVAVGRQIFCAESTGSIVVNKSRRAVAAIGLDNVAIVVTDDAVLAIPRAALPRMKAYLAAMKSGGTIPQKLF